MRFARTITASAACLCLLAACSPSAGPSSSGSPAATAPDVETPVVDLKGLPHPAAGYWELTLKDGNKPPQTSRFCQADEPLWARHVDSTGCMSLVYARNGRGDIVETGTCKENGFVLVDRSVYQGDLSKAYVIDETSRTTGPTQSPELDVSRATYRLIGACPPGGK